MVCEDNGKIIHRFAQLGCLFLKNKDPRKCGKTKIGVEWRLTELVGNDHKSLLQRSKGTTNLYGQKRCLFVGNEVNFGYSVDPTSVKVSYICIGMYVCIFQLNEQNMIQIFKIKQIDSWIAQQHIFYQLLSTKRVHLVSLWGEVPINLNLLYLFVQYFFMLSDVVFSCINVCFNFSNIITK